MDLLNTRTASQAPDFTILPRKHHMTVRLASDFRHCRDLMPIGKHCYSCATEEDETGLAQHEDGHTYTNQYTYI